MSLFKGKTSPGCTLNEYSETDYKMSDSDAHRDVEYRIPSQLEQLVAVIKVHLKLFSKNKLMIGLLVMVLAIPVIVYLLPTSITSYFTDIAYAGILLFALPLMMVFIPAILLARSIPSEFRDRTAYLNLALPQSRMVFYAGKFIAGMMTVTFLFLLTYGEVVVITTVNRFSMDAGAVLYSFVVTLVGCFAICAAVIALSTFMKKGSTILTVLLFYFLIPAAMVFISIETNSLDYLIDAQYLPSSAGSLAISILGAPPATSSIVDLYEYVRFQGLITDFQYTRDLCIYMVLGVLFFLIGLVRFNRREL
ncbi:MAG: ABC transporter permease [Candidatus Methanomethylophilaceae archaeon]|nr:ABC transporter permease [Candidatus Methanomethylophilaceae archaeon]